MPLPILIFILSGDVQCYSYWCIDESYFPRRLLHGIKPARTEERIDRYLTRTIRRKQMQVYTRGSVVGRRGIEVENKPLRFHLHRAAAASSPRNFDLSFTRRKHLAILVGDRTEPTKVNANKMDPPLWRIKLERRYGNFGHFVWGLGGNKRKVVNPKKRGIKRSLSK